MLQLLFNNILALSGFKSNGIMNTDKIPFKMKGLLLSRTQLETKPKWRAGGWSYNAVARTKEGIKIVSFNLFGQIIKTTREINWNDLPKSIIDRVKRELGGTSLKHVFETKYPEKIVFEIHVKKDYIRYRVVFNSKGILLNQESWNVVS